MFRRPLPTLAILACALVAPAGASADHGRDAVVIEGTLQISHSDDFRHGRSRTYYSLQRGARTVKLDLRSRRGLRDGIRVRVRGRLAQNRLSAHAVQRLSTPPARKFAATGAGPRRVAVLLFNFTNDASQPYTPAQARGVMFDGPSSLNAYFQEESFGSTPLSGDVFGWYTIGMSNAGCAVDQWAQAASSAAAAAGVNLASYNHVVYAFPTAASCGWAGLAEMPGSRVWVNGAFNLRVVGHELTHNLGTHHAATLSCTEGAARVPISTSCTKVEYGDPFDIMGSAASRHTSSWHKGQLGWLNATAMQTVSSSGTFTIAPHELFSPGVQSLRIARGTTGNYFYLEFRQPYGTYFDNFAASDPAVRGVTIRMAPDYWSRQLSYLIDTTATTSGFGDAPLAAGQTFTDSAYGISVRTASVSATGATVEVSLGGAPPPSPPPPPPPPPPSPDTTPPTVPESFGGQVLEGPQVKLNWTASTDNVGVTGYRVSRSGAQLASTTALSSVDAAPPAGKAVAYEVRAYDAAGNLSAAATTSVIVPSTPPPGTKPPSNSGVPVLTGAGHPGETLSTSPGTWEGTGPFSFAYRWLRCNRSNRCSILANATSASYVVTAADVGRSLRVTVTATNASGSASATSAPLTVGRGSSAGAGRDEWNDAWSRTSPRVKARVVAHGAPPPLTRAIRRFRIGCAGNASHVHNEEAGNWASWAGFCSGRSRE
ncbi:MAG: hypothetical protein ABR583_04690 [Gaiellaceae bacterium]